jgi:hypothetical protein
MHFPQHLRHLEQGKGCNGLPEVEDVIGFGLQHIEAPSLHSH